FGDVRHEDLHTDEVPRMRPRRLEGLNNIAGGDIELLGERAADDRPIGLLRRLAGEVNGAARLGNDGMRETLGRGKRIRIADFVRAGYRPLHLASRPSRNAA